jgi:Recombinase
MADLKERATAGLRYALLEVPEGRGRYKHIADLMNERGIKTFRGGRWTSENVRRQLERGKA